MLKPKLLLLDKDGTLVAPASEERFVQHPKDQKVLPGVRETIARYEGAIPVIVSNQGGVAAHHKTLENAIAEMRYCMELLPEIEIAYFCPDFEGQRCFAVTPKEVCSIIEHYIGSDDRWHMTTNLALPSLDERVIGLCRKPNPGMLNVAIIRHLEYEGFSKEDALMVGDRPEDEAAARAAGVEFVPAESWRNLADNESM